jgi:hypothetical protein
MKFTISLLESDKNISNDILKAFIPKLNIYMNDGINIIKSELPGILRRGIALSPEYDAILNGILKYEFGIPDSSIKLAGLIDIWANNIEYSYQKPRIVGSVIKSSFSANAIRVDFADVLYTDFALVIDGLRAYSLPWLEWLLLEGNKTIIKNYEVSIGPNKRSRTGNAIMKQSRGSWKVPSEYAGTINDNWITRAIDGVQSDIESLLNKAFSA